MFIHINMLIYTNKICFFFYDLHVVALQGNNVCVCGLVNLTKCPHKDDDIRNPCPCKDIFFFLVPMRKSL